MLLIAGFQTCVCVGGGGRQLLCVAVPFLVPDPDNIERSF